MSCGCENECMDGVDGKNAFTFTSASFVQPAVSSTVVVSVNINDQYTGKWAANGQVIYIVGGGYYTVSSVNLLGDQITVTNLGYSGNASPGATISSGVKVSPAGLKGDTGATGTTGAPGAAGINGVSVLYSAQTPETLSGTSAASFTAYAMPQATFAVNKSELDIDAFFTFPSTHDDVSLYFKIGSVDLLLPTVPGLPISSETKVTNLRIMGTIKRVSATTIKVMWTMIYLNEFTPIYIMGAPTYYTMNYTALLSITDLDSGGTQNLFFKRGVTAGSLSLTMEYLTIRYANKA